MKTNDLELNAKNRLIEICKNLKSNGFIVSDIDKKQFNYEITSSKNKQKNKVQVYFGKKGIKIILQGNTQSKNYKEIESIVAGNYTLQFEEKQLNYDEYIGTDESGKGDFFGPLVTAGVFVDKKMQSILADLGVRDSKELPDNQIDFIATKIKKMFPKNFTTVVINPEKYNQLYHKFKNLNLMLNWAHSKAIENLFKIFQPKYVIIDQFSKSQLSISQKSQYSNIEFIQLPKAEQYIGVAAASILARNEVNKWFNKKQSEGFNVLKGASINVENSAKKILMEKKVEELKKLVKLHFKTAKKIFED